MSQQPSVASYFGKRKRLVNDEIYKAKLLKTDSDAKVSKTLSEVDNPNFSELKPSSVVGKDSSDKPTNDVVNNLSAYSSSVSQQNKEKPKIQVDIRESLKKCHEKHKIVNITSPVKFQLLGSLSPAKKNNQRINSLRNESDSSLQNKNHEEQSSAGEGSGVKLKHPSLKMLDFKEKKADCSTEDIIKSAKQLVSKIKETQKKLNGETNQKKELSLKEIKDKIKRSSKLSELKKSINKINEHAEELIELEQKKLLGAQPKLSKFKTIEIEVPVSPKKDVLYSPVKQQRSSNKPAYERFASLVDTSTSLPLPIGYQRLYELFCAADTICSMMLNRKEVITFNKLKPAVEEMTRKNFTLRHLGQMATVLKDAFSFHQEKLRNFGSTSKVDRYELVITPKIPTSQEDTTTRPTISEDDVFRLADRSIMTPKILKTRKEAFYNSLLERTKDHHEEFLKTLDPPLTINRNDLKRWHPSFSVDLVPDVNPQELPQPPTSERPSTAKEILERAKDFLSSNARLHKALEAAAGESSSKDTTPKISLEVKEKVDARLNANNPLKGIPKSLLEKVRARQAAKALDVMRLTPEQEKESLMYARLPDIARIVRTVFINEQKSVILLDIVLEKVQFSYSRNLSLSEIEAHVRLLSEKLPEWLTVLHIRNANYLKISRSIDVTSVMNKLKKIVEEKNRETKSIC